MPRRTRRAPLADGVDVTDSVCGTVREVLLDATGQQIAASASGQRIRHVADTFQEVPVVRDDDQRAGPAVEVVLDDRQGVDVQIVGRLVEQQHVGFVEQQSQELQAAPLTAGELSDPGRSACRR